MGRRRVKRAVIELVQLLSGALLQLRREIDEIVVFAALPIEGWWPSGPRLRGRRFFARHLGLGRRALFDGPDGLTRLAIEREGVRLLRDLNERLDATAVDRDVAENRLWREVVI